MSTAEDVYCVYERNSTYYFDCIQQGNIDNCPYKMFNMCHCYSKQVVFPLTIGNCDVPCELYRKCYIKPGEECPICFDPILQKSNAYITCCGHSFHKSCIFKAMEAKWKDNYAGKFCCPICRTSLGMDLHELNIRYTSRINHLDDLENVSNSSNYILSELCSHGWNHYAGFNKNCKACLIYRNTGEYI
jgi:hypothetical protein